MGKMQAHSAAAESMEEMYARVYRELRPGGQPPVFDVQFRPFAGANSSIRLQDGLAKVRITDLLQEAPAPVLEALAFILLAKLLRQAVPNKHSDCYRRHLNRPDVRRRIVLLRQSRGRKFFGRPKGRHYDLEEIFAELNQRYFDGLLAKPVLGWTRHPSRTTLGHYDPSHNTIVISRHLDRPDVPRLAVEYLMFHEMLHLRHPAREGGTRRRVHTKEFREAEKQFPGLRQVKALLNTL